MPTLKEIKIKPIGFVRRVSKNENVKDRNLISEIFIQKKFARALDGIEEFSHLFVVFYMHQVSANGTKTLKVHPRGREDLPEVGIFATRTSLRPNPVGLAVVELLKRKGNILVVKGLDAIDGTPVLDLKPYDSWDTVMSIRVASWRRKLESEVEQRKN